MNRVTLWAFASLNILPPALQNRLHGVVIVTLFAGIRIQPRPAGRRQTKLRAEGLHDLQVLHGDTDLRYLLHISAGRLEDGAVLRQEFLRFTPPRVCLAVTGERLHVVLREDAHGDERGRQTLPFLFRFRHQPGGTLHIILRRHRLILVQRPASLAPVALQRLQRCGQGLPSSGRHFSSPSFSCRFISIPAAVDVDNNEYAEQRQDRQYPLPAIHQKHIHLYHGAHDLLFSCHFHQPPLHNPAPSRPSTP